VSQTSLSHLRSFPFALAALFASSISTIARAEDGGPGFFLQGGLVTSLVLDPTTATTMFAATGRGLYRTLDGGKSWTHVSGAIGERSVISMALDPAAPARLVAGTDSGGLFRSGDGGAVWTAAASSLPARYVAALTVDPVRPGVVYAGSEAGRLYRSGDAGATWRELTRPILDVAITCITADPASADSLWVGTNSMGLFHSTDGGATWAPHRSLTRGTVWNVTMDPVAPRTIYAGTHDGLFRSVDGGETWKRAYYGLHSLNVLAIAIDPSNSATLYAGTAGGIYKSIDGSQTWNILHPDVYVSALIRDPRSPQTIFAGTQLGLLRSDDAGGRWVSVPLVPETPPARGRRNALPFGTRTFQSAALPPIPILRRGLDSVPQTVVQADSGVVHWHSGATDPREAEHRTRRP